jgi:hypothetical protein
MIDEELIERGIQQFVKNVFDDSIAHGVPPDHPELQRLIAEWLPKFETRLRSCSQGQVEAYVAMKH